MGCGTGAALVLAVPLFHIAGVQMMLNHFVGGGTHPVIPAFSPSGTLAAIEQHGATDLMLVPTMLQMLVTDEQITQHDLSSLRRIFYGAAPITEALLSQAMSVFPMADFIQGYVMSESGITLKLPAFYHTEPGHQLGKMRSSGVAAPLADIRICDALRDKELAASMIGEIQVRGPMVMRGYWEQPMLTAQALQAGWLHTGDLGYMDEDGSVFIVDRLNDMIVSGGENIYSAELKNVIASHPAVQVCAVIGTPHEKWGEAVHACIVLKPDRLVTAEELVAHCRERIASYKCPVSIEFRRSLPMSAAGKLLKYELRDQLRNAGQSNVSG